MQGCNRAFRIEIINKTRRFLMLYHIKNDFLCVIRWCIVFADFFVLIRKHVCFICLMGMVGSLNGHFELL